MRPQKFFVAMKEVKKYVIDYRNLKEGKREWSYTISGDYFKQRGSELIVGADIAVRLMLDKKSSFGVVNIEYEGTILTACDRCLEDLQLVIHGSAELIVKESVDDHDDEEDVIFLDESGRLNVDQSMYDYVSLSMPMIKYCDTNPPCNAAIMAEVMPPASENGSHPAWNELRKLKF